MSKLTGLHEAMACLDVAWSDAADSGDLSRVQLIAVNDAIGLLQRRGVLLCETCHHRIHDNGWGIRIDTGGDRGGRDRDRDRGGSDRGGSDRGGSDRGGARVWFIPPAYVDPPRLGGRARFDIAA